ncbi:hypothetical protein AWB81_06442 [Caballeronia arationis]|nr:hypothetical protein AWB81_06442 [Caballeronia arationis]
MPRQKTRERSVIKQQRKEPKMMTVKNNIGWILMPNIELVDSGRS